MNLRWQQYNEQRHEQRAQLIQRNYELEQLLSAATSAKSAQLSISQQVQIDRALLAQKSKFDIAEEGRIRVS